MATVLALGLGFDVWVELLLLVGVLVHLGGDD